MKEKEGWLDTKINLYEQTLQQALIATKAVQ
jgi:hypothetical protein